MMNEQIVQMGPMLILAGPRCRLAGRDFHGPTRVGLIVDMGLVRPMQRSVLDAPSRQGARRAESGRPRD